MHSMIDAETIGSLPPIRFRARSSPERVL